MTNIDKIIEDNTQKILDFLYLNGYLITESDRVIVITKLQEIKLKTIEECIESLRNSDKTFGIVDRNGLGGVILICDVEQELNKLK